VILLGTHLTATGVKVRDVIARRLVTIR